MTHQPSFSQAEFAAKKKTTRREKFLARMEEVIPWPKVLAVIEPHYPKGERGRPPIGLERMLRVYFLQQWYGLADEAIEDALYDSQALRGFRSGLCTGTKYAGFDRCGRFGVSFDVPPPSSTVFEWQISWVKFAALTPSDRHPPRKTNHWIGQNRRYLTVSGLKTMVLCWFHPFLPSEMAFFELGKSISRKGKSFSLEGLLHSR